MLRSAVDRTPFHTKYIASRIAGLEDEVLLLKQFMKGIGVYGSELKDRGLLRLSDRASHPALRLFLRSASGSVLLAAGRGYRSGRACPREHQEPLVVVDPVDPARNVAAALTLDKMFQFVAASRCFLEQSGAGVLLSARCEAFIR